MTGADCDLALLLRAVAHGGDRHIAVALTHRRRQTRYQLKILLRHDGGGCAAEISGAVIGKRHESKAAEGVVHAKTHLGLAIGIELYHWLPTEQRVEELASRHI